MTPPAADRITIREVGGHRELEMCVRVQYETWGEGFGEAVPPAILWVATRTGGMVAGAFDGHGAMVGFLFGLSGWRDSRPLHWSDMLAVVPAARGRGLGRRLKEFQRDTLLERGIEDVYWTFDPLESRNAHLNFARLGITVREYARDCYCDSASPLHQVIGTDRLVAHWHLSSDRVRKRMEGAEQPPADTAVARFPLINAGDVVDLGLSAPRLRLRIPADIQQLKSVDAPRARAWRETTRQAFEEYLARGYVVTELVRETAEASSYVLERSPAAGAGPPVGAPPAAAPPDAAPPDAAPPDAAPPDATPRADRVDLSS
jgi:predicted GNAT superfamily acetyltransferase